MEQTPRGTKLDRRWAKPIALAVLVAVASAALAYLVTLLPVGQTYEARQVVAGVVMMCCSAAGYAWVVVVAFDAFDVEAKSRQS